MLYDYISFYLPDAINLIISKLLNKNEKYLKLLSVSLSLSPSLVHTFLPLPYVCANSMVTYAKTPCLQNLSSLTPNTICKSTA